MSQRDTSTDSGGGATVGTGQRGAGTGRSYAAKSRQYLRRAVGSGAFAGVTGSASLLRGLRALRRGDRGRGLARLLLGVSFLVIAAVQRRSASRRGGGGTGIDQTDVVDTAPDIEDAASETDAGDERHATGDAARDVVDTSPEIEDAGPATELDSDVETRSVDQTDVVDTGIDDEELDDVTTGADGPESAALERLGEAAFDEQSGEIPVPQRVFNRETLSLDDEAFWGIRDDDGVVVSGRYDPLEEGDETRYVASSRVDDERMLEVPDTVLNHWDDVAESGTAVTSGDGIVFATSGDLEADSQLLVVPARWSDEVLGETEE